MSLTSHRAKTRVGGNSQMARPRRFERPTTAFGGRYSIQLSYGRVAILKGNYTAKTLNQFIFWLLIWPASVFAFLIFQIFLQPAAVSEFVYFDIVALRDLQQFYPMPMDFLCLS